ncbi:MAG: sodium:proton antiporter [candidate division Zixibacteria bacterium]|nr:sodium:proton antiporter [candidate division Zixibacteria bacterium]
MMKTPRQLSPQGLFSPRPLVLILLFLLVASAATYGASTAAEFEQHVPAQVSAPAWAGLPLWSCIPFVGILLSIAIIPMVAPVFWHHHFAKVSFAWGLIFAVPFIVAYGGLAAHELAHEMLLHYLPFIILLWGLFTVSGGIYLSGTLVGKPMTNVMLMLIGTALASWMGTTGAAMLLIRPLIRANKARNHKVHTIVFFIFLVANIGGLLTPLGDPPLFLGFLNGVPFFWTFQFWPKMVLATVILLALYFVIDSYYFHKEKSRGGTVTIDPHEPLRVHGAHNFLLLLGIVIAVLLSGTLKLGEVSLFHIHFEVASLLRDALIVILGIVSLKTTTAQCREANGFSWFPIKEVGFLFIGIFMTIVAPLKILQAGAAGSAAPLFSIVGSPASYFWLSGTLSSFLDNAPTYLTFFNMSLGNLGVAPGDVTGILTNALAHPNAHLFIEDLTALSVGSVFFGANTYIGNAPNFMVRSIAEEAKIPMPSFFGYILWSIAILVPLFLLLTVIFFM